eukprot:comp23272_c0_seq1/m.38092 comp23272_c0_seq1/g.38092  ORF comp23272_c0_seq1/g.38092 comp23272_c0_seq1/m.38092 type:complete len:770 (-) comp23272_c0_seq1:533-2842(-)
MEAFGSSSFRGANLRQRLPQTRKEEDLNTPLLGEHSFDDEQDKGHAYPPNASPMAFGRIRTPIDLPEDKNSKTFYLNPHHRRLLVIVFTVLGFVTRFWRLHEPHSVVFDEVHFGGFASKYLQRIFFFDVHPPTGKLLYALAGWLSGYDGTFTFKEIHMDYVKHNVPYVGMRALPALCGALMVPLAFLTVNGMGYSVLGASLAAAMVLFENSFVTQSRFILLDSPMMLFIAWAVYCYTKFRSHWPRPFEFPWWLWLVLTGIGLGLAVSVKWVGLFVIAYVGLQTIFDLWTLLGEKDKYGKQLPMLDWFSHFFARAVCLIVIPLAVYIFSFYIHLAILQVQGPGTAFMSSDFREGLMEPVHEMEKGISSSAQITFKAITPEGTPYLHSHPHKYPVEHSSQQQQITAYGFKDHNNWFSFTRSEGEQKGDQGNADDIYLRDGNIIYIGHVATERGLFVHGYPAPITKSTDNITYHEVSAWDGQGHKWRIELSSSPGSQRMLQRGDQIRLINIEMNCALACSDEKLPEWGFNQNEVTCTNRMDESDTIWQIDETQSVRVSAYKSLLPAKKDRSGLFTRLKDIVDLNVIAWDVNKRLTDTHIFQSRPQDWPHLSRGISYWQDANLREQVYLVGNPILWWTCLLAPPLYAMVGLVLAIRHRRQCHDLDKHKMERFVLVAFLWLGFLLHFLPFFLMQRQLFLHHYLPAHYFMILAFAAFSDHLINWWLPVKARVAVVVILALVFLATFMFFAPFSYATQLTEAEVAKRKWRKAWDMM